MSTSLLTDELRVSNSYVRNILVTLNHVQIQTTNSLFEILAKGLYLWLQVCITREIIENAESTSSKVGWGFSKLHIPTLLPIREWSSQLRILFSNDYQHLQCIMPIEVSHNLNVPTSTYFANIFAGFFAPSIFLRNTSPSSTNLRVKWYRLLCFVFIW